MVNSIDITSETNQLTLKNIWEYAVNEQFAVAIWRLPLQESFHLLADISGKPQTLKVDIDDSKSGFCLSPFINPNGDNTLFLKNDIHFVLNQNGYLINENEISLTEKILLEKVLKGHETAKKSSSSPIKIKYDTHKDKENFENIVKNAIDAISSGKFQKVVLSRLKKVEFSNKFDLVSTLQKLSIKYPRAFVSAIYLPESNTFWLGASPELLVSLDKNGLFKTMSLAGTQTAIDKNGQKISPNNARWSQKEIEEQAFVSRYIIECFKKVRVREYLENGPKTVEAGNLLHLQTDFSVDTGAIEFCQFATVLLELLHPTSAVCGMPKANALSYILENENYDRGYYSGYLGPVNIDKETHVFVNLRTLRLNENVAELYAGAGITEDSVPENEWNETEIKMETLLQIINENHDA